MTTIAKKGFTIITHNGRLPSRGGQILGIKHPDGRVERIGSTFAVTLAMRAEDSTPKAEVKPVIKLTELPYHDGWCSNASCRQRLTFRNQQIVMTDQGDHGLTVCPSCKRVHR
jgi:capsular polysaccharide biosynthesis protein